MVGDAKGYRFEPANITVKQGDGIKFVVLSGGPHNVAFDPATIPADVKPQLDANMGSDKMGELSSALKTNNGESVTLSLGNIKPGQYPYHCTALGARRRASSPFECGNSGTAGANSSRRFCCVLVRLGESLTYERS
jgi:plastocyanin